MTLTILSLRTDYRSTEGWFEGGGDCPYIICNIVFKIDRDENLTWERAKAASEDYKRVLTIDDPERYGAWLTRSGWNFKGKYDGYNKSWIHNDPPWRYIEKFNVFWLREVVADCSVTRSILSELYSHYTEGKLPSVYRTFEPEVVLKHLECLSSYWD